MNYLVFGIALVLSFYAFAMGQTFFGTIGIAVTLVYLLSESLQGLSGSQRDSSGSSMSTPSSVGGDERVAQNVGKGVHGIGSFLGFIVKSILFPSEKAEEKKDSGGPGRGPGGARRIKQTVEHEY